MIRATRQGKIGWLLSWCLLICLSVGAGCGGSRQAKSDTPGGDREFDRLSRQARSAFDLGQISRAIAGYEKALARAMISDDHDAIVDTHYNLGVCHLRQGDFTAALKNANMAQKELQAAGRPVSADFLLLQAAALYYGGSPDRAWDISEDMLSMLPTPSPETLYRTHFLRGRIAADRGESNQLRMETTALGESSFPGLKADRFELIGRLAMLEERWDDAVTALDEAARLRAENGNYRLMAVTLAASAQACERAQRSEDAAYRYLRAARSAVLSEDMTRAAAWLQEAERLAQQAGSESILEEARRFQALLSEESQPQ